MHEIPYMIQRHDHHHQSTGYVYAVYSFHGWRLAFIVWRLSFIVCRLLFFCPPWGVGGGQ
jgi:hypothetical protein